MKTLKIIGFISLFLGLIILMFVKSCKHHKEEKQKNEIKKEYYVKPVESQWIVEERKVIYFTDKYGEMILISSKKGFSFENSSEPYCIKNLSGKEFCGQTGEDVGKKMGWSSDNNGLKFKSNNGKSGQVTMFIWKKSY